MAVVEALRARGDDVLVVDLPAAEPEGAEALGAAFFAADLTSGEACRDAVAEAIRRFGRLDILVNNAGIQHVADIESFPEDRWRTMIDLMLTAPFVLTQAAWPHMRAAGWGRIVNMASIHAKVASPGKAAYVSAKHGLIGLTRTAALEGGEHGITVNALCPAYVRSRLVENQVADQAKLHGMDEDAVISDIMLAGAAIKRLIEPAEVAATVAYLASDAAAAVTGAAWDMDLGWTAR
ncbi:3-hydroxybutyrate dehydrogenase [Salinisphaera hydrothermalis C41B8]|uniref:3-hydroxybutyrate dehydrogenase n=1 Tax=Salinisphaera hydrothermalis (strain C41B8) TaxID=1304275 RepID=A0A084IKU2_SALHC|nr:3-hydroxybutyrate dehydrogenase [Salinisphaera hydrothermalis C41B8]